MRITRILILAAATVGPWSVSFGQAPGVMRIGQGPSYIGVNLQEIDSERAKALKLKEEAGVEITRVEPDSPADKAGIKPGDVVINYDGQRVEGMEQFSRMVRETPPGREAKLDIVRSGAPQTIVVKVAARRGPEVLPLGALPTFAPMDRFEVNMPDVSRSIMSWRSAMLGMDMESLDGQLAQYFGVKEGVLVRSVTKGSSADKAGLKAGDVITRIDDSRVASPGDISMRLRSIHEHRAVPFVLMRDRKETTVAVPVEDDDRGDWFQKQNFVQGRSPVIVQIQ